MDDKTGKLGRALRVGKSTLRMAAQRAEETLYDSASARWYSREKIQAVAKRIQQQAETYESLKSKVRKKGHRFMDGCFLGGDLLADIALGESGLPAEIARAYEAAYPDLASAQSFAEAVLSKDDEALHGFVSGIKGKLFEMEYVDFLNSGELPEGYAAKLADSATQPGWDIEVAGPDDEIAQLIQAKATDSVEYVRDALENYPDIDVVTTDEVYSHLAMTDMSENVIDSGLSNEELTEYVEQAAGDVGIQMDWSPPLISLALIAFTTYRMRDLDLYEKAKHFGGRFGANYVCLLIGRSVAVLTQMWPLGIAASLTSRYLAGRGRGQRELYYSLKRIERTNDVVLARLSGQAT